MEASEDEIECEQRAAQMRNRFVKEHEQGAGGMGPQSVIQVDENEWLDSGQIRGVFLPAYNYRAMHSVQAGLAMRNLDDPESPLYFRWGFIGSTDTHDGRPAVGTSKESVPAVSEMAEPMQFLGPSKKFADASGIERFGQIARFSSFRNGGGLAAVHAEGRSREAIWAAFKRREIYATSGERILLWFNHVSKENRTQAMGSELFQSENPQFEVRAAGDFHQLPGCPNYSLEALGQEKVQAYCNNECYHPSEKRKQIEKIEVVRIRPQQSKNEFIGDLIEDPWKVIDCSPDSTVCKAEFSDPEFAVDKRDTIYYVRALQKPSPAINAGNLQTRFNQEGDPVEITLCTAESGCPIEPIAERAWSSPIYIHFREPRLDERNVRKTMQ